jgi:hypothetical protein
MGPRKEEYGTAFLRSSFSSFFEAAGHAGAVPAGAGRTLSLTAQGIRASQNLPREG